MHILRQHISDILSEYRGRIPLAHFLKAYFKSDARLGSRDRKAISAALYGYYRLSRFFPEVAPDTLIGAGLQAGLIRHPFLNRVFEITADPNHAGRPLDIPAAVREFKPALPLSAGLEVREWAEMLIRQRALFIRLRKNHREARGLLEDAEILFTATLPDDSIHPPAEPSPGHKTTEAEKRQTCLVLENGLPLDKILAPADYVIQDYAVQAAILKIAGYCRQVFQDQADLRVWDTCAGAGGKTLYWKDLFPSQRMLATDLRASILHNLRQRARLYGTRGVHTRVLDLSAEEQVHTVREQFDIIFCDVPCSGSGTWGRTPEQFHFADAEAIRKLPDLQYRILSLASRKLRPGGLLAYITCSAFAVENEAVAEKFGATMPVSLIHQELIRDAKLKSDFIYLALFRSEAAEKPA